MLPKSTAVSDAGLHTGRNHPLHYLYVVLCYVTSAVFGLLYLSSIMVCALVSSVNKPKSSAKLEQSNRTGSSSRWRPRLRRSFDTEEHSNTDYRSTDFMGPEFPALDEKQSVLRFDLRYYVQLQGYDLEEHTVITKDGFHIVLQHIVVPGESHAAASRRFPVLLLHGLLQSAAAYCTSGNDSLAFYLVAAGYDVWLGNNRCGFRPSHEDFGRLSLGMWAWRIQEMGHYDVQALLDYVVLKALAKTPKVALVAHSQGTAQTFLALAAESPALVTLSDRLACFVALSPAVYTGPLVRSWFLGFIRHLSLSTYRLLFGHHAYMAIMMYMHSIFPAKLYSRLGYLMFRYMFGWTDALWDQRYRDRQLLFSPVYVSAELMFWWLGHGGFADRGCLFHHDRADTPWFDAQFPPLQMFVPGEDNLVDPQRLVERLRTVESTAMRNPVDVVNLPEYAHLDVLWAKDAVYRVGAPMNHFIKSVLPQGRDWLVNDDDSE